MSAPLVARLRKQAKCIYIAVEATVADDVSDGLTKAADTIDELCEALAEMVEVNHTFPSGVQKRHAAYVKAKAALARARGEQSDRSELLNQVQR